LEIECYFLVSLDYGKLGLITHSSPLKMDREL
jgi:hypothetical protein